MIPIIICDDEKNYIDKATEIIRSVAMDFNMFAFSSAEDMLSSFPEIDQLGIFIIDIDLPGLKGMEAAKEIRTRSSSAIIIFLTNYEHYVFEGYKVGALRYVRKGKMDEELGEAVLKAIDLIEHAIAYIVVNDVNTVNKIHLTNIVYLEKYKKYVEIHITTGEVIKSRSTLNDVVKRINHSYFIEIRRGVIVNAEHIKQLDGLKLVMDNNSIHYISRNKIKEVKEKMIDCWRN